MTITKMMTMAIDGVATVSEAKRPIRRWLRVAAALKKRCS
jgi:hypothetical protein